MYIGIVDRIYVCIRFQLPMPNSTAYHARHTLYNIASTERLQMSYNRKSSRATNKKTCRVSLSLSLFKFFHFVLFPRFCAWRFDSIVIVSLGLYWKIFLRGYIPRFSISSSEDQILLLLLSLVFFFFFLILPSVRYNACKLMINRMKPCKLWRLIICYQPIVSSSTQSVTEIKEYNKNDWMRETNFPKIYELRWDMWTVMTTYRQRTHHRTKKNKKVD